MIVRKTTKEENQRVNELFSIAFELPLEPVSEEENPRCHHWAAYTDDGDMMSTFTVSDFNQRFDGHSCKMGGIGGVATLPQYRRMGGIRECFSRCLPDMYQNDYIFSYLYPFSTAYYRKFGYECCVQKLCMHLDLGLLKPVPVIGHFALCEKDHPYKEAIQAVDQYWESRYNMMVIHEDRDYGWTQEFDPAGKLNFTYVYFAADGTPKAYTRFRMEMEPDGRNLKSDKLFFVDKEGFDGLMNLFKSLSTDHKLLKFCLPAFEGFEYLMPEWSMGAAQWSILNGGMVRVINVRKVLEMASYHGSGAVKLEIQDPQIPKNTGVYSVVFENGKAQKVEKCQADPDIRLTVPAFSALICGAGNLNFVNGVEILKDVPGIRQTFLRKPMMIADYFSEKHTIVPQSGSRPLWGTFSLTRDKKKAAHFRFGNGLLWP